MTCKLYTCSPSTEFLQSSIDLSVICPGAAVEPMCTEVCGREQKPEKETLKHFILLVRLVLMAALDGDVLPPEWCDGVVALLY